MKTKTEEKPEIAMEGMCIGGFENIDSEGMGRED